MKIAPYKLTDVSDNASPAQLMESRGHVEVMGRGATLTRGKGLYKRTLAQVAWKKWAGEYRTANFSLGGIVIDRRSLTGA